MYNYKIIDFAQRKIDRDRALRTLRNQTKTPIRYLGVKEMKANLKKLNAAIAEIEADLKKELRDYILQGIGFIPLIQYTKPVFAWILRTEVDRAETVRLNKPGNLVELRKLEAQAEVLAETIETVKAIESGKPIYIGDDTTGFNLKTKKSMADQQAMINRVIDAVNGGVEPSGKLIIAPRHTLLHWASQRIKEEGLEGKILLAAQTVDVVNDSEENTGTLPIRDLKEMGITHSIVGHSEERRNYRRAERAKGIKEEDIREAENKLMAKKAKALLDVGITPIFCVGEEDYERYPTGHWEGKPYESKWIIDKKEDEEMAGHQAFSAVLPQLEAFYDMLTPADFEAAERRGQPIVIAYEPVWAIGTGLTATPEEAEFIQRAMRVTLAKRFGKRAAEITAIEYGGSVKIEDKKTGEKIAEGLAKMANIWGANFLVGGAAYGIEEDETPSPLAINRVNVIESHRSSGSQ